MTPLHIGVVTGASTAAILLLCLVGAHVIGSRLGNGAREFEISVKVLRLVAIDVKVRRTEPTTREGGEPPSDGDRTVVALRPEARRRDRPP